MYYENNLKFGFYIIRRGWGKTIAKVVEIEGVKEGNKLMGKSPYFNYPKVTAEFYNKEEFESNDYYFDNVSEVSCPNTYSYSMIDNSIIK